MTTRLDTALVEQGLAESLEKAQAYILAGRVWLNAQRLLKAGLKVDEKAPLELRGVEKYVSRGGYKLEHALQMFSVFAQGRVCLDIGASTGGFTDCLLQVGAKCVFAVDVGYGQLDLKLRKDSRVLCVERQNARAITAAQLTELSSDASFISLVTIDVSFISLEKIILGLSQSIFARDWILLFKPQFEVDRKYVEKGGVVRNEAATASALKRLHLQMERLGFLRLGGPEKSPVAGKKSGNVEFLLHYAFASKEKSWVAMPPSS